MNLSINHWIHFRNETATKDGNPLLPDTWAAINEPQDLYRALSLNYMKFFKMDLLCKWAWLGAEVLLNKDGGNLYEGIDRNKVAVVLITSHGCIDVDKKYLSSMEEIPSPALFVYTLPNIMLGELSIRHGFKGEQLCLAAENFDAEELFFWVDDLLNNRGMEACLCGWVDVYEGNRDVCLFWVKKQEGGITFSKTKAEELYKL